MDDITKMIVSAAVAYLVPRALGSIGKTFAPARGEEKTLPWVQWLLACFIGGAFGGALSAAMGEQGFGNWAVYGAAIGIMQWFALRTYLPVGGWWALASAAGWSLAPIFAGIPGGGIFVGLAIGILQVIGLDAQGRGWWIGGNAAAWGLTGILLPFLIGPVGATFGLILGWMVGWGLIALIGASLLLWPLTRLSARH